MPSLLRNDVDMTLTSFVREILQLVTGERADIRRIPHVVEQSHPDCPPEVFEARRARAIA